MSLVLDSIKGHNRILWVDRARSYDYFLLPLITENLSGPRPSGPSKRACHTCHGVTCVARVVELLVFRTLSLVDRRATSIMPTIRARTADGWTTFCGDEAGCLDGARITFWILWLLAEPYAAGACYHVSLPASRDFCDHCNAL